MPSKQRRFSVLDQILDSLWQTALSPTTRSAYRTGSNHYLHFMVMYGMHQGNMTLPPMSEEILLRYIAYSHGVCKLTYSTIKLYLCGIRFAYMETGHRNPLCNKDGSPLFQVYTVLRAVKRSQVCVLRPRMPITFALLSRLCQLFRQGAFTPYLDLLMETCCTVAFFGFMRCGEFTSNLAHMDPATELCIGDVSFPSDNHAVVHLKASKCDPFRRGVSIHLYTTGKAVCPVTVVRKYLQHRIRHGAISTDPLFINDIQRPLTRTFFVSKLKQSITRLGLDHTAYTGHSFRIGAATTAAAVRLEDHLIRTLGRWASDSYTRYIRTPQEVIQQAQISMSK